MKIHQQIKQMTKYIQYIAKDSAFLYLVSKFSNEHKKPKLKITDPKLEEGL